MRKLSVVLTMILSCAVLVMAQESVSPKREFRSAWMATVWAIDWPSSSAAANQKAELETYVDNLVDENANAVFFQVRTMCDAYYNSAYEPWSQWLTGTRGGVPSYDPLTYLINKAHEKGIEVHVWLNPYRYASGSSTYGNLETDYPNTHPEWLLSYSNGSAILNPGMPEVRQRIVDVVKDILSKYDVDGVVFDDYFYSDQGTPNAMDSAQYNHYNPNNLSVSDWRRENVNQMIADVQAAILAEKPYVRFGVGPAGIAATNKSVADSYGVPVCPTSSDWQYSGIYSDPLAWVSRRTIDYIAPQVYWVIGARDGDFSLATPWWYKVCHQFGTQCFISASLSGLGTKFNTSEPVNQTLLTRDAAIDGEPGMVFYSAKKFVQSSTRTAFKSGAYTHKALVPAILRRRVGMQGLVTDLAVNGQTLSWEYTADTLRFAVYAIPNTERNDYEALTSAKYLLGLSYGREYTLPSSVSTSTHAIAVTVVDRYGNEFAPRFLGEPLKSATQQVTLLSPADGSTVFVPAVLRWQAVADAMSYRVEVATDPSFTDLLYAGVADSAEFSTQVCADINKNNTFYWRVLPNVANATSTCSATRSFTGKPFAMTSPADGETDVPQGFTATWGNVGTGTSYTVNVATSSNFYSTDIVWTGATTDTSIVIPEKTLLYGKSYYIRVKAETPQYTSVSPSVAFTMADIVMTAPVVLTPLDGDTVRAAALTVTLDETPNNGFRFAISQTASFPTRKTTTKETETDEYSYTFEDLDEGLYYVRAATRTASGLTDYGESHSVYFIPTASALDELELSRCEKRVENGQVVILRGGKKYSVLGVPMD